MNASKPVSSQKIAARIRGLYHAILFALLVGIGTALAERFGSVTPSNEAYWGGAFLLLGNIWLHVRRVEKAVQDYA